MSQPIVILGVELTKERFPNLYRIAETNPEGLAAQLKYFAEGKNDPDSIGSAAVVLELDLEHERLSSQYVRDDE